MAGRRDEPPARPKTVEDDDGFLGRWSRRKAEARAAQAEDVAAPSDRSTADQESASPIIPEEKEPPAFDVSKLPDIDSLGPGSDFSPFMQAGVPSALKTKALRKLWRVKPELANLDGLLDYGEDLTGSFKAVDHLKTAYEVGRGFLRDRNDEDQDKAAAKDGEDDDRQDEPNEPDRAGTASANAGQADEIDADASSDLPSSPGQPNDEAKKS